MSKDICLVYKPLGISPLDAIELLRKKDASLLDIKIGYAGRLDPMAEGLLILMLGDENKNRDHYLHLDKRYDVSFVLGMSTDSYDILGNVQDVQAFIENTEQVSSKVVKKTIDSFVGKIDQQFPPFSSKPVQGKPLFWWAREGKLDEIDIPSANREIYSVDIKKIDILNIDDLQKLINTKLEKVKGNFRQDEIKETWATYFANCSIENLQWIDMSVHCSSGTYMRSLVHDIGKELGVGAVTTSIVRTEAGPYTVDEAIQLRQL